MSSCMQCGSEMSTGGCLKCNSGLTIMLPRQKDANVGFRYYLVCDHDWTFLYGETAWCWKCGSLHIMHDGVPRVYRVGEHPKLGDDYGRGKAPGKDARDSTNSYCVPSQGTFTCDGFKCVG